MRHRKAARSGCANGHRDSHCLQCQRAIVGFDNGVRKSGRPVLTRAATTSRAADDKILEHWAGTRANSVLAEMGSRSQYCCWRLRRVMFLGGCLRRGDATCDGRVIWRCVDRFLATGFADCRNDVRQMRCCNFCGPTPKNSIPCNVTRRHVLFQESDEISFCLILVVWVARRSKCLRPQLRMF